MIVLVGYAIYIGDVSFGEMKEVVMVLTSILMGLYGFEDIADKFKTVV